MSNIGATKTHDDLSKASLYDRRKAERRTNAQGRCEDEDDRRIDSDRRRHNWLDQKTIAE